MVNGSFIAGLGILLISEISKLKLSITCHSSNHYQSFHGHLIPVLLRSYNQAGHNTVRGMVLELLVVNYVHTWVTRTPWYQLKFTKANNSDCCPDKSIELTNIAVVHVAGLSTWKYIQGVCFSLLLAFKELKLRYICWPCSYKAYT